jgi:glutathione peroxidase
MEEDGEKQGKLKRSAEQRMTSVLGFLGILCLVFLVAIVKLKHSPHGPRALRHKAEAAALAVHHGEDTTLPPNSIYRLMVEDGTGSPIKLTPYSGMVSLVVNVASKWGKTDISYRQLSELQEKFGQGFSVLAFPSNDYGQEFEQNSDIQNFVQTNYPQVTFPVLGTTHLPDNSVYQELQRQMPRAHVQHNFYKYLINRQGVAVRFYDKKTDPLSIADDIEELLTATSGDVNPHLFITQ